MDKLQKGCNKETINELDGNGVVHFAVHVVQIQVSAQFLFCDWILQILFVKENYRNDVTPRK